MDIEKTLSQMTLEEKATITSGYGPWATPAIDRLDIPKVTMSDGPHGMRAMKEEGTADLRESLPATCFPTAACFGSSWDIQLAASIGEAIAEEARELGYNLVLGPGMNIKRTPLCGRNFEYISEDPVLTGEMAGAFVEGSQSKGVGATIKHFACNNSEFERMSLNVQVDERPLRELYLAAFERVIRRARPWAVMGAYNRVNGEFACEHPRLLSEILKGEWLFEGLVMSDWTAVNDRVSAIAAGLDLEMPGPSDANDRRLAEAVRAGELDESVLDERVRRVLYVADLAGKSGINTAQRPAHPDPETLTRHHALARRAAAQSTVLLKNEGDLLPFEPTSTSRLAVIGRFAETPRFQGGGSSKVNAARTETVCSALGISGEPEGVHSDSRPQVYEHAEYAPGYDEHGHADARHIDGAVRAARAADAALLVVGLPDAVESEGFDRSDLELPEGQTELIRAVVAEQPRTAVIIVAGSVVRVEEWIDEVPAVALAGLGGQAGGGAIVDVVTGEVAPSGRLTETMVRRLEDSAAWLNYPGENGAVHYGEGLFVGYRWHDESGVAPRYPFGHGISYSRFEYGALSLSAGGSDGRGGRSEESESGEGAESGPSIAMRDTDALSLRVPVRNAGSRSAAEVVQLYIEPPKGRLRRPRRELKAFSKLHLAPGTEGVAEFSLSRRDFACFDPGFGEWISESGEYRVHIGSTSADIRRRATIDFESTVEPRRALNEWSPMREWLEDERGRRLFSEAIGEQLIDHLSGGRPAEREMFLNIPLKKVPQLTGGRVSEEAIAGMLDGLAASP